VRQETPSIAREQEMIHPQFHELRAKLRAVLETPADASSRPVPLLSVYDLESKKEVLFVRCPMATEGDRRAWAVRMVFSWPATGDRERAIAERLGLPAPTSTVHRGRNPFTGEPFEIRSCEASCEIGDIDRAVSLCLAVLHDIHGISEGRRFRITDAFDDPDEWPIPSLDLERGLPGI
jgi:hypothetical protein